MAIEIIITLMVVIGYFLAGVFDAVLTNKNYRVFDIFVGAGYLGVRESLTLIDKLPVDVRETTEIRFDGSKRETTCS